VIVYNLTRTYLVVLLLLNFILGCKENSQSIKGEKIPQNKSELYDLNFSGVSLKVEVAALPEERELGLMFRNSLKENEGMLFVFKEGSGQRFWMKNTRIPLDIGYLSTSGVLLEVHKAKPYDLSGVPSRSQDIKFVLELNAGGYKKLGIKIGSRISLKVISELLIQRGIDPLMYNL
jgi:uncharacterized membrane protein (UPF0127 family)